MKFRLPLVALAALALMQSLSLAPALAEMPAAGEPAGLVQPSPPAALQPCPANVGNVAQLDCCKGHKGICGCRAGKIVCCDGSVSAEPNCTCHGDDAVDN